MTLFDSYYELKQDYDPCYSDDEGDEEHQIIRKLTDFQYFLRELEESFDKDNEDCFEDWTTTEYSHDAVWDIHVPVDEQTGFFEKFNELLKALTKFEATWRIHVNITYDNEGRRPQSPRYCCGLSSSKTFHCEGYNPNERSSRGPYIDIIMNWMCRVDFEDSPVSLPFYQVLESLGSMPTLRVDKIHFDPTIQIPDTMKCETQDLTLRTLSDKLLGHFPNLKRLRIEEDPKPTKVDIAKIDEMISTVELCRNLDSLTFIKSTALTTVQASIIAKLRLLELRIHNGGSDSLALSEETLEIMLQGIIATESVERLKFRGPSFDTKTCEVFWRKFRALTSILRSLAIDNCGLPKSLSTEQGEMIGKAIVAGILASSTLTEFKFLEPFSYTNIATVAVERYIEGRRKEIDEALKLNKAGRWIVDRMPSVPPSLVPRILSNANQVYDATGIYQLVREHTDLRKVIAWYAKLHSIPSFVSEIAEAGLISPEQVAAILEYNKRRRLN